MFKPSFDYRLPRLDAETEAGHQLIRDTASMLSEKTAQMKEAVIRQALGPDAPAGAELRGRMRWEHRQGAEYVFLDDKLLVVFHPGRLNIESGTWDLPYSLCHVGNRS